MRFRQSIAMIGLAISLSACQTYEERRAEQDAEDHATCLEFGAKRGSDAYVRCRTDLQGNRERRRATAGAVVVGRGYGPYGPYGPYGGFCRPTYFGVRCY